VLNEISFSDKKTIKLLIIYRWKFDSLFVEKKFKLNILNISNIQLNENIICIYAYLDELIKECSFSKKVNDVLYKIMLGYSFEEIGDKCIISSLFDKTINRIIKINDIKWKEFIEYSGYIKIPNNSKYKQCKKCQRWLEINTDNFNLNENGYYVNTCLFCKNNI